MRKATPWKKQRHSDFNVDLLKYEDSANTTVFFDKIYSTSLIPQITSPTRITPWSKTLIDNIFSTNANAETLSGNIVTNISNHLAQFFNLPLKQTPHKKKNKIYKRNDENLMLASLSVTFEILIGKTLLK